MAKLSVGDPAPDFELPGTEGPFKLSDHRGQRVVLLFYPGDQTAVCTRQFCSYRDAGPAVGEDLGALLVGISTKNLASKEAFKAKHGLTTPLLADEDGAVADSYGVYSRRLKITKRTVVIVDEAGRVAHIHANPLSLTYDDTDAIKSALAALPVRAR
jgi:peroxiredoxin Q/BCP